MTKVGKTSKNTYAASRRRGRPNIIRVYPARR
jgi:hypothetical protein